MTPPTRYALVPFPRLIVSVEVPAALRDVTASLAAAISLLERSSKKAAPSNAMFDMMLIDYSKSLEAARSLIRAEAASPNAGCVTAEMLERAAEAFLGEVAGHDLCGGENDCPVLLVGIRSILAALGLAVSDETQRGETVDG